MKRFLLLVGLFFLPTQLEAEELPADNPEMAAIAAADQAERQPGRPVDWNAVAKEDEARRGRVRELLDQGKLATGKDFDLAALVFQHGSKPEDFLLAHVLAVRAIALGADSQWIAAATLDRYLQKTGKGQVYGTQYQVTPEAGATMEPYDKALLPDSLRVAAGAHSLEEQEAHVPEMEAMLKSMTAAKPE